MAEEISFEDSEVFHLFDDSKNNISYYKIINYERDLYFGVKISHSKKKYAEIVPLEKHLKEDILTVVDIFFANKNLRKLFPDVTYVYAFYQKHIWENQII